MAYSSSKPTSSQQEHQQPPKFSPLVRTCPIPTAELEVLCELMVDFDNLREHDFNLKANMMVQGWNNFFDRLIGPVYPDLVKEFWIHSTLTPKAIISFVLGQEIFITENLIRKATVSPTYINQDQQYLLYCIGKGQRIDLPHLLFIHMWNHVKDSREQVKRKNQKIKRNIIPLGRLISDILTESGLIDSLLEAGAVQDLEATCGSTVTTHTLKKMKLITSVTSPPRVVNEIRTRRTPVDDFQLFFKEEHPKVILFYLESCLKDNSEVDPAWLHNITLPSLDVQKAPKKRKTTGEGPSTKTKKKKKTSGISISDSVPVNICVTISTDNPESLKIPRSSKSIRKLIDDIYSIDDSILEFEPIPELPPKQKQSSKFPSSTSTSSKGKQPAQPSEPIILNPPPLTVIFPTIPSEKIFSTSKPPSSEPQTSAPQPQPTSSAPHP
ncbi:uncharacterized protein LOC131625404 [Vicia villosa]|uniref:uncharacterized protein LOC131625404 n=1 Tax=Vicia villosa TaxID=3911 RepID=UPI00273AF12B|nr:uncharacterized protein LOC131625404 [Vicia villosa]